MIKSDFYTFSIILLDVHVIRGQSQDRAFGEHARISLNLAHREFPLYVPFSSWSIVVFVRLVVLYRKLLSKKALTGLEVLLL